MDNTNDSSILGSALADAIERVGPAVLHVRAGERLASGTVWSAAERLIVTTSRLFHDAGDAAVELVTGAGSLAATLVGVDEATELALVRAEPGAALAEASWTSGPPRLGTFVAPIGRTTSGLRAAFGIVSRVGPAWVTPRGGAVDAFIEVDGQLPPGFSGGPLIDLGGAVLGVNTRGLVPGGATLPTSTVRRVVGVLASGGTTSPGHLGVAIQEVELPEALRAEPGASRGLLVTGVVAGSGAAAAGILVGDTLIAIDGHATTDHAHLLAALAGKANKVVKVRLARHGQALEVEATPAVRAEKRRGGPHGGGGHGPFGGHGWFGPHGPFGGPRGGWGGKRCR